MDERADKTLHNAEIEWQDSGAPWSREYGDVYFSREGGMEETRHVFLNANALESRWREQDHPCARFTIGELGFGTGLNFLSCWHLWRQTACQDLRLHYISCEKHPLSLDALQRALTGWPELERYRDALLNAYPEQVPGYHRLLLQLPGDAQPVTLDLYYGDAETLLRSQGNRQARIDAWFLDGFTPARNPALWSDSMLETLAGLSHQGTTLSSYSVTGRVVRKLQELDFVVEKRKGFGHKRHMLFAKYLPEKNAETPKAQPPQRPTATVIGAGLAGSTVAWSLARRGYRVTVLEQEDRPASGASGNPQAILQCRLNRIPDALWQFNLLSFLYAARFYDHLQTTAGMDIEWHRCGVLTLQSAYQNTRKATTPDSHGHYPQQILRFVSAAEGSRLCGLTLQEGGLFLEDGGWLNPVQLCQSLLSHPGIELRTACPVSAMERKDSSWDLLDAQGGLLQRSDQVVIANSHTAREFSVTADYPVFPLRGQISFLPADESSRKQQTVICGRSYLAPVNEEQQHCLGASYVKDRMDTALSAAEHEQVIAGVLPDIQELSARAPEAIPGRAALRGRSGDFVPMAGPVPDPDAWRSAFGGAQHLGRNSVPLRPELLPGLYMTVGHGSHGMASCPLLGEHIAALISGEASPLTEEITGLVHPWRFIARRMRKARKTGGTSGLSEVP